MILRNFRERLAKKLARFIYGGETMVIVSKADLPKPYAQMDDLSTGRFTKAAMSMIDRVHAKAAEEEGSPISVYMHQHASINLVAFCLDINADTLTSHINGVTTSKHKEPTHWRILIEKMDEPTDLGDDRPVVETTEHGGKIVGLTFNFGATHAA